MDTIKLKTIDLSQCDGSQDQFKYKYGMHPLTVTWMTVTWTLSPSCSFEMPPEDQQREIGAVTRKNS